MYEDFLYKDLMIATPAPEFLIVLKDYHTLMEAQLQDAHVLEKTTKILGNGDNKDSEPVKLKVELLFTDYKYQHRFANILRYSVITSAYSIFEVALHDLCGFAQMKLHSRLCLSDIARKSSEIERVKTYLDRLGIDVANMRHWEFLTDLTKVRNAIVHDNGWLYESEPEHTYHIKNLRSVIGKLNGIRLNEDGLNIELCVEKSFCDQLIANIETAVDDIYEAIWCQTDNRD
jgi:hypothetical protein